MRIEILDEAREDLIDGFNFYEKLEVGVGSYFLDCLVSDIDSLLLFAGIHQIVYGYHRSLSKRFPFAIYYDVGGRVDPCSRGLGLSQKSSLDQETAKKKRLTNRFRPIADRRDD
ncbi:MAG: type II toxin-antitoxin system RelE/ParE family toxin [Alphaproteobacteria bacterium]